jgi:hypothetical protein
MRPFQFDLSTIPHADLAAVANWSLSRLATFPAFAAWLADLMATELRVRGGEQPRGDGNHYFPAWTDAEVADALEGITALSFAENVDPTTGKLLDTITIHVAALAAGRLRTRDFVASSVRSN